MGYFKTMVAIEFIGVSFGTFMLWFLTFGFSIFSDHTSKFQGIGFEGILLGLVCGEVLMLLIVYGNYFLSPGLKEFRTK
jgi:hypothetical protein